MFLRKLMVLILPLVLCLLLCGAFYLTDGELGGQSFWGCCLKGALLGSALALVLPIGGIQSRSNGLTGFLLGGAVLLFALLCAQYLTLLGVLHPVALQFFLGVNLQVVLLEAAFVGFCLVTGLVFLKKS